jgi:hypothetical protein
VLLQMINVPNHFIPLENRTCVLLWLQLGVKKCTVLNHVTVRICSWLRKFAVKT